MDSRLVVIIPAVLAIIVLVIRQLWLRRLRRAFAEPIPGQFPYYLRKSLLTPAELHFYRSLEQAVGPEYLIAFKVRLADVLGCSDAAWKMGYGKLLGNKHLDFVLVEPGTSAFILAIELDDRSHAQARRRFRDEFIDKALAAAGVPLVRVPAARRYSVTEIRKELRIR